MGLAVMWGGRQCRNGISKHINPHRPLCPSPSPAPTHLTRPALPRPLLAGDPPPSRDRLPLRMTNSSPSDSTGGSGLSGPAWGLGPSLRRTTSPSSSESPSTPLRCRQLKGLAQLKQPHFCRRRCTEKRR